jgi:hypothetical protein
MALMQAWRQASKSLMHACVALLPLHGYCVRHDWMHGPFWVGSKKSNANVLGTSDSMRAATKANKRIDDRIMDRPPFIHDW